ncbi:Kinesin motor domain [Trinorchestia longiramus]|nr:Kinesin motor domain [Trinorchestia longiramus]
MRESTCPRECKTHALEGTCPRECKTHALERTCPRGRKTHALERTCPRGRKTHALERTCPRECKTHALEGTCPWGHKTHALEGTCPRECKTHACFWRSVVKSFPEFWCCACTPSLCGAQLQWRTVAAALSCSGGQLQRRSAAVEDSCSGAQLQWRTAAAGVGGQVSVHTTSEVIRVRPQIAREVIEMCRVCTSVTPGEPQVWLGSDKAFTYDHVFDTDTQQEEVYTTCVHDLIEGCFKGYNATVLAYGQTGSGKTYTMGTGLEVDSMPGDVQGIVPRAVHHLFQGIADRRKEAIELQKTPPEFKVSAHFMELYNEEVIDLFDPVFKGVGKSSVKIHEDAMGGIHVSGITTRTVNNVEDAMQCLRAGALSRTTASTNMNAQSSRSHAVFTINLTQQRLAEPQEGTEDEPNPDTGSALSEFETLTAKFHFVDLAGSERLKRTGATGDRARESISINCGLLALGNVISALGDVTKKASHVPYRDSKLTRLLQDSLGGNSQTVMIACISPSDTDFMETLNTLKYANRARNIKNRVTVNQDKTSKTIAFLRMEIQQLQLELMEYRQGKRVVGHDGSEAVNDMYHENQMLSVECGNLRTRVKALQETVDVLTAKNTALLAEKATGQWVSAGGGEDGESGSDMTSLIQGYLQEIEELRAKLCESEQVCQQLRKQVNNRANARFSVSPLVHIPMSGSVMEGVEDSSGPSSIAELIEEAKHDLQRDMREISAPKKRKKKISRTLFGSGTADRDIDNEDGDTENNKENETENGDENMDEGEIADDGDEEDVDDDEESSDESSEDKEEDSDEEENAEYCHRGSPCLACLPSLA